MTDQVDQNPESSEVSSQESQPEIDVKAMAERLQKLEATNQRLLDESVQYKNKYKTLRTEIEEKQHQALEQEENWKELYESERKKTSQTLDQLHQYKKTALQRDMHYKVAASAKDAWDVGDVINALPKDMLQIDDESNSVGGVDDALTWVKQNKPHLFKQHTGTGMSDSRPKGNSGKLAYEDLNKDEKNALFAKSLKDAWFS